MWTTVETLAAMFYSCNPTMSLCDFLARYTGRDFSRSIGIGGDTERPTNLRASAELDESERTGK